VVAARIDIAMRLLAVSGDPSTVPFLVPVAGHEDHFLRWNAVRSVMALDPETGMRLLRSAADDCHPHVRDAARRSLAALERAATEGAPA
jgi:HEAT repeat protein